MPRKEKEREQVKYYMPAGSKEKIDLIVDGSSVYKNKAVWKQKFYQLADYIAAQNFQNELDVSKDYVNIHQETMSRILGVDNQQIASILKHASKQGKSQLLKKDGIFKAAVISRRGKEKEYVEEGKSYGYQFVEWNELAEIEIADNRGIYRKIINNTKEQAGRYYPELAEYNKVLSSIKIELESTDEIFEKILFNKRSKKSRIAEYDRFIEEIENRYHYKYNYKHQIHNNNLLIPFDGVIVPPRNLLISKAEYSYLDSFEDGVIVPVTSLAVPRTEYSYLEGGVIVPCEKCTFQVQRFKKKKRSAKVVNDEPEQTTIARCDRSMYIINNGFMAATRKVENSRVHCEITHLNRELRRSVRIDGKKIV